MDSRWILSTLIVTLSMFSFVSCFSPAVQEIKPAGFLSDYSRLHPASKSHQIFIYLNKSKRPFIYRLAIIDPVKIYLREGVNSEKIDPAKLDQLALNLREEIVQALGNSYQVVEKPVFGAVKIRTAITNLAPDDSLFFKNRYAANIKDAVIEVEIADALSGEVILSFADFRKDLLSSPYNTSDYSEEDGRIKWWANDLRDSLDQAQGYHPSGRFPATGAFNK